IAAGWYLAQRLECRTELGREQLRLLPGCEVAALGDPVVINELRIRSLSPAPRRLIQFVRKRGNCSWDLDVFWRKEREFAFPIQASRRNRRVREPVQGDVVEDVVARKSLSLTVEYTRHERHTGRVVVEHPGGHPDRRISDPVERLRAMRHFLCVAQS